MLDFSKYDLGSVYYIPTDLVETYKWAHMEWPFLDWPANLGFFRAICAEHRLAFDKMHMLSLVSIKLREDEVLILVGELLAVHTDVDDYWDLHIPSCNSIALCCSFFQYFFTTQQKCLFYGVGVVENPREVFRTAFWVPNLMS